MNRENDNNSPVPEQRNNEDGNNVVNNNDIEVGAVDLDEDDSEEDVEWG